MYAQKQKGSSSYEDEDEDEDGLSVGLARNGKTNRWVATSHGPLSRFTVWATFEASDRQRLLIQGGLTFLLAYGAILFGRHTGDSIATIWWVNMYLAYCFLLYSVQRWFWPITVGFGALLAANIAAGNDVSSSILLSLLNLIESVFFAVLAVYILTLQTSGRRVIVRSFFVGSILLGTICVGLIIAVLAVLAGPIVTHLFGGSLGHNIFKWANGDVIGGFAMATFSIGKLIELHLGFKRLSKSPAHFYFVELAYLLLCAYLFAVIPMSNRVEIPHIMFIMLSIPLAFLPSLFQAGSILLVTSALYLYFGSTRGVWSDMNLLFVFVSALVSTSLTIIFVARYLSAQHREAEQRALEFAPNALLTFDRRRRLLSISKFAEEWFDRAPEKLIGKRLLA